MDSLPKPPVSPPWTCQCDSENEIWAFINMNTGERTYDYDFERMASAQDDSSRGGGQGNEGSYAQQTLSNTAQSLQDGPENIAYDIGATVDRADEYKNESEGVAERFTAKVADWFSGARNDVEGGLEEGVERVEDAPENAMAAVGEGVGNVERFGEDVGEAVTDAPYDAMRKVGEGFEDVRQAGENVEQYGDNLGDAYQQGRDQEQYD